MARISNEVKQIAEKNQATMAKYKNFKVWVKVFLRNKDRIGDYEKAHSYVNRGKDEQADIELRSGDENQNDSPL